MFDAHHVPFSAANLDSIVRRTLITASEHSPSTLLLLAASEMVGELGELWKLIDQFEVERILNEGGFADHETECGDVLWGIGATAIRSGIPIGLITDSLLLRIDPWRDQALSASLSVLEEAKKVCRDQAAGRKPQLPLMILGLHTVFVYIRSLVDLDRALSAVDYKLRSRYPDGFDAKASIDRND